VDQEIGSVVVSQTPRQTIKTRWRQGLNLQIVDDEEVEVPCVCVALAPDER
jgi:hypothetical protein